MPLRFRRTIKVAPGVKLNLSKSGVSTTVGTKNLHFNFGKRGVKRTVSIPGTGISEVDYIKKNGESDKETEKEKEKEKEQRKEATEEKREERLEAKQQEKEAVASDAETPSRSRRPRREAAVSHVSTGLRNAFVLLGVLLFFFAGAAVLGLVPTHFLSNSLRFLAHVVQTTGH